MLMTYRREAAISIVAALLAALGVTAAASPALSGSYVCNVPRALLCEGCASQMTITLVRGGGCRVAFTPGAPGGAPAAQTPFNFVVQTPAVATQRPYAVKRVSAAQAPAAAAPRGRCFVFNGNQYCE
jgi:hypothetical protein